MLTLGINTSGPACDVALLRDGDVLAEAFEEMVKGQDARLPGIVSTCLAEAGETAKSLDRIGVVTGPGSFTGVRVGVSFARGFALATGTPCIGVTALEAALPGGQQGSAIVLLPAKRRLPDITYWTQRFRSGEATGVPEEAPLETLIAEIEAHPHFVYGTGLERLLEAMPGLEAHDARPSARRAAEQAAAAKADGASASPVYVRAPDAALPGGAKP